MEDTTPTPTPTLSCRELFLTFSRAGMAFGGGPGIMAALEEELVSKRQVVTREDFLAKYALGRLLPCGTMSAVAVAYGYRFGGLLGTVAALTGLVLPPLGLMILLTMAYTVLQGGPVLSLLTATLLPAAVAFIALAALKLGREVFRPSLELLLATGAFVAILVFNLHPMLVILGSGLGGALALNRRGEASP